MQKKHGTYSVYDQQDETDISAHSAQEEKLKRLTKTVQGSTFPGDNVQGGHLHTWLASFGSSTFAFLPGIACQEGATGSRSCFSLKYISGDIRYRVVSPLPDPAAHAVRVRPVVPTICTKIAHLIRGVSNSH